MQCSGSIVVSAGRLVGGWKRTKIPHLSLFASSNMNLRSPFAVVCAYHSLVSASVVTLFAAIAQILTMGRCAQVCSAVVQAITISMVNVDAVGQQGAMHVDKFAALMARGIKGVLAWSNSEPSPARKKVEILSINDGDFAACEWNKSIRCVEWLSNCLAFIWWTANAGHVPTSNRNVLLSHFSTSGG